MGKEKGAMPTSAPGNRKKMVVDVLSGAFITRHQDFGLENT